MLFPLTHSHSLISPEETPNTYFLTNHIHTVDADAIISWTVTRPLSLERTSHEDEKYKWTMPAPNSSLAKTSRLELNKLDLNILCPMAKWWELPEYDSYNEEYSESADLKKAETVLCTRAFLVLLNTAIESEGSFLTVCL